MEKIFNFQNYKLSKLNNFLFLKLLIINNTSLKIKQPKIFSQNKITNIGFTLFLKVSIFKNFKTLIIGNIYFVKYYPNDLNKKQIVDLTLNSLAIKLNNKIYFPKKILNLNFLTYNENLLLLFQINILQIKRILKS